MKKIALVFVMFSFIGHMTGSEITTVLKTQYAQDPLVSALLSFDVAGVKNALENGASARATITGTVTDAETGTQEIWTFLPLPLALTLFKGAQETNEQQKIALRTIVQELVRHNATPQDVLQFSVVDENGEKVVSLEVPASLLALTSDEAAFTFLLSHGMHVHTIFNGGRKLIDIARESGLGHTLLDALAAEMARQPEPVMTPETQFERTLYLAGINPEEFQEKVTEILMTLEDDGKITIDDQGNVSVVDEGGMIGSITARAAAVWKFIRDHWVPVVAVSAWGAYELRNYFHG